MRYSSRMHSCVGDGSGDWLHLLLLHETLRLFDGLALLDEGRPDLGTGGAPALDSAGGFGRLLGSAFGEAFGAGTALSRSFGGPFSAYGD